jgi:hypothetical protein
MDSLDVAQLKLEVEKLEQEKKIAELRRDLFGVYFPQGSQAEGTTVVQDTLGLEVHVLALEQLHRMADSVKAAVDSLLQGGPTMVCSEAFLERWTVYESAVAQAEFLERQCQLTLLRPEPGTSMLVPLEIPLIVEAARRSVVGFLGLFRSDVALAGAPLSRETDLLAVLLARRLDNATAATLTIPVAGEKPIRLLELVRELKNRQLEIRETRDRASMDEGSKAALTKLAEAVAAFLEEITAGKDGKPAPLVSLIQTGRTVTSLGSAGAKVLVIDVTGAHAGIKEAKNGIVGSKTRFGVLVTARYALFNAGGSLVDSDVRQMVSGYVEARDIIKDVER